MVLCVHLFFDFTSSQSLPEPLDRAQQRTWSSERNISPHGRWLNDSTRDATSPPLSQEPSFTSSNWTPPPSHIHEPPLRVVDYPDAPGYHKPPFQTSRMDINSRQTPPAPILRDGPAQQTHERYHRQQEAGFTRPPRPLQLSQSSVRPKNRRDALPYFHDARRPPALHTSSNGSRSNWNTAETPADENQGPRLLNERISELVPEVQTRGGGLRPLQGIRQDKGYHYGEPDLPGVRTLGHPETRQDHYPPETNLPEARTLGHPEPRQEHYPQPNPPEVRIFGHPESRQDYTFQPIKTFEQRLDSAPVPRAGSLLSRISHGNTDDPMMAQSLRDRVQTGNKRDRDNMSRSHLLDGPIEADDGDLDVGNRRRKRRRARRGGGP